MLEGKPAHMGASQNTKNTSDFKKAGLAKTVVSHCTVQVKRSADFEQ